VTVQWCRLCHADQLQTDLQENAGNWALMQQGKHIVPMPVSRCFSGKTLLSPHARLPSPYSAWLCPKVHPSNMMVLTWNSFPYAIYVIPFNVVGLPYASLQFRPVSVCCRIVTAETECEMGCWNRNRISTSL